MTDLVLAKWMGWSLEAVRNLDPHEYAVLVELVKESGPQDT